MPTCKETARLSRAALCICLLALVLGLLAAAARADLIIFQDGFLLHGKIKREMTAFRDPVSGKLFHAARLDGFFHVDDGARQIVFSAKQVADATKQDFDSAADLMKLARVARFKGGQRMPALWQVESVKPFSEERLWQREIVLAFPDRKEKIQQRLTELTPHRVRLEASFYEWDAYYLTREFEPETIRKLLYQFLDRQKVQLKPEEKCYHVFRFLLQAGWYDHAEKELAYMDKTFPAQKKEIDARRKILQKLQALQTVDNLERAHKSGQHREARATLEQLDEAKVDAEIIGEQRYGTVAAIRARYRHADENLNLARKFLVELPKKVRNINRRQTFQEAAKVMLADLNPDTLARIDGFLGLAEQAERDRKNGRRAQQTPEELLALAVSGWLMGNDAAEGKVDWALALWEARAFVLKFLRTGEEGDRRQLLEFYGKRPTIPLDELAQMIRFLPPANPEETDKGGRKGTDNVLEFKADLRDGLGRGTTYHVQLPPEYHPYRAYPVLFVLSAAGEDAKAMLKRWSVLASQHGYLLVAPEWKQGLDSPYTYSAEEHGAVVDVLRDLRRRFQVDSDRVFLFGFEEGGNMAFDVGLSHPDLFAGVIPMAARPRFFGVRYWANAQYLPFYVIDGTADRMNPKFHRDQFKEWARYNYPAIYVEYKGRGLDWFGGELPIIFDWMSTKKRAHPRTTLGVNGGGGSFGQEFKTMRETDNHFYWLTVGGVHAGCLNDARAWKGFRNPAKLEAHVGLNNHIYINTQGVKQVTLWLAPGMINFEKQVTVSVNSTAAWNNKIIAPDLGVLLQHFYQQRDRQRIFLAKKEFTLR